MKSSSDNTGKRSVERPALDDDSTSRHATDCLSREAAEIDEEVNKLVTRRLKQKNSMFFSEDNSLSYSHGATWTHVDAATGDRNVGTFAQQSADASLPVARIVDNDATVIVQFVEELAEKMHGVMARSVYQMVEESATQVGNSMNLSMPPNASEEEEIRATQNGLLDLLSRMDFGVDRNGVASAPQLHIHPKNQKMIRALTTPPSLDDERKIADVFQQKEQEAISREVERISRFRRS